MGKAQIHNSAHTSIRKGSVRQCSSNLPLSIVILQWLHLTTIVSVMNAIFVLSFETFAFRPTYFTKPNQKAWSKIVWSCLRIELSKDKTNMLLRVWSSNTETSYYDRETHARIVFIARWDSFNVVQGFARRDNDHLGGGGRPHLD